MAPLLYNTMAETADGTISPAVVGTSHETLCRDEHSWECNFSNLQSPSTPKAEKRILKLLRWATQSKSHYTAVFRTVLGARNGAAFPRKGKYIIAGIRAEKRVRSLPTVFQQYIHRVRSFVDLERNSKTRQAHHTYTNRWNPCVHGLIAGNINRNLNCLSDYCSSTPFHVNPFFKSVMGLEPSWIHEDPYVSMQSTMQALQFLILYGTADIF